MVTGVCLKLFPLARRSSLALESALFHGSGRGDWDSPGRKLFELRGKVAVSVGKRANGVVLKLMWSFPLAPSSTAHFIWPTRCKHAIGQHLHQIYIQVVFAVQQIRKETLHLETSLVTRR